MKLDPPLFHAQNLLMKTTLGRSELTLDKAESSTFTLDHDELVFFRSLTKIDNEDELKAHIVRVQQRAYEVSEWCFFFSVTNLTEM